MQLTQTACLNRAAVPFRRRSSRLRAARCALCGAADRRSVRRRGRATHMRLPLVRFGSDNRPIEPWEDRLAPLVLPVVIPLLIATVSLVSAIGWILLLAWQWCPRRCRSRGGSPGTPSLTWILPSTVRAPPARPG